MTPIVRIEIALAMLCLASLGCAGGDASKMPTLGKVVGVVTLDGDALDQAIVEFRPDSSRGSMGITDAEGKYELRFDDRNLGAAVGKHKVLISTRLNPANDKDDKVPTKYNEKTELTADVEGGENTLNFELISK